MRRRRPSRARLAACGLILRPLPRPLSETVRRTISVLTAARPRSGMTRASSRGGPPTSPAHRRDHRECPARVAQWRRTESSQPRGHGRRSHTPRAEECFLTSPQGYSTQRPSTQRTTSGLTARSGHRDGPSWGSALVLIAQSAAKKLSDAISGDGRHEEEALTGRAAKALQER